MYDMSWSISKRRKKNIKLKNRKTLHKKTVSTPSSSMSMSMPSSMSERKSVIVHHFLEMLNTVKLYHWKTKSFAQHKATDELYEKLNKQIDRFTETLLGKDGSRVGLIHKKIELEDVSDLDDFIKIMYRYRVFLQSMNDMFDSRLDSDLLNIRDEMLGDINQFLYLLTFH